jgi:hypothetical protein
MPDFAKERHDPLITGWTGNLARPDLAPCRLKPCGLLRRHVRSFLTGNEKGGGSR